MTQREIGERLGFSRRNSSQKKARPAKDSLVSEKDKLAALRYKLARKETV